MKLFSILLTFFLTLSYKGAYAIDLRPPTAEEKPTQSIFSGIWEGIVYVFSNLGNILLFILIVWLTMRIIRLAYEVLIVGRLFHVKVSLPRADSKLDKEQDTKKDFKEKIGIMALFYKSIHSV